MSWSLIRHIDYVRWWPESLHPLGNCRADISPVWRTLHSNISEGPQPCYAQPSTVFMISHPIHHFHQPPCTAQPVLHCTGCTVYSTPWVITSLPAGHCLVGIYYLLYFTQSTLYNQIHSGCGFLEITIILESLSIDRVGRFWVVAKIWETFTCLSRHWFLEHEYIVKSTPSR